MLSNSISTPFSDLPARVPFQNRFFKKSMVKIGNNLLLFWFLLFGTCFSVHAIETAKDESTDTTVATQTFSFVDVYQIKLDLDIPGNVRIIALDSKKVEKDTISVTLEKQVLEQQAILSKSYLENISLFGEITDGTLQINSQLPVDLSKGKIEYQDTREIKEKLQLNYEIKTPPDVSVQLNVKNGDVYLHHIRGNIEVTTESGNVELDETLGTYQVHVKKGRINGKILLTPGQNEIKTDDGSINLTVLDDLAAPLDLTALGGKIELLLPTNYPADVELANEKQQYIMGIPAEIEENKGTINGGGPLLRLTATDTIQILKNPRINTSPQENNTDNSQELTAPSYVQPIPFTERSPTIDGNLTEKAWLDAIALTAFQNPIGTETAENPTDVSLMWDNENLYIGTRMYIEDSHIPRVSQTQLDSPIWEDECVEILIDMNPDTEDYLHLIVNPIGGFFDQQVQNVGYPHYRYAPKGVKREEFDDSAKPFKADSTWNSGAKVATKINTNYWSFEIAVPRKDEKKQKTDTWLLNIHRKSQYKKEYVDNLNTVLFQEFSYWLPLYDEEFQWWPHWKEAMGTLKLVKGQPSTSETYKVAEKYKITAIEIEGNTTIPTKIVLEQIPIDVGDTISNEQITKLIAELDHSDLFEEVQLKTVVAEIEGGNSPTSGLSDDTEVTLQINLTEALVQQAKDVSIIGNKNFPALFIKRWFDLLPGYISESNAILKQQMINDFYVNRGFPFVKVTHQFENEVLQYNINEGSLDEVRFTGNRRIQQSELSSALDMDTEGVYFHAMGRTKINNLQKKLSKDNDIFKSIRDWYVQREGGKNVLVVDIEETPFIKPGWYPILGYNRVHGLFLGVGGTLTTHYTGAEQLFGSISRGFSSKILNYSFGVEKSFFERYPLAIGVGLFKLTDMSTNAYRLHSTESNLSSALYGTAHDDFYQRQGEQIWIAQSYGTSSLVRLQFTQEDHENLTKSTDWSYFDRNLIKRGNARIDTGNLKAISIGYTFDTRDKKSTLKRQQDIGTHLLLLPNERTKRGWRGHVGFEKAGGVLGGKFNYNFYNIELVRYNQLYGPHQLNFRLSGDFSDSPLPRQQILFLGGSSNLRGYDSNKFAGDRRLLLNIEYRLFNEIRIDPSTDAYVGWTLTTFLDTGQTWWYGEKIFSDFSLNDFKTAIGFGSSFFVSPPGDLQPVSTSVEIAIPLSVEATLRTPRIIWRLERMF